MATNGTPKIHRSELKCPSCLANMTEPRAFPCFHMFCQRCIDDLKPVEGEADATFECPVCEQRASKDKIQPMDNVKELLDVARNAAKSDQLLCEKCETTEKAIWRCHDCKENFCDPCKRGHDGYSILKHHKWEKLSADMKAVLDKHVYCKHPDHSGELVKLHCKDCNELICLLCNGTEHKTHEAETISKAIENALPVIKENKGILEEAITTNSAVLEGTANEGEERKKKYEDLEKQIDQKCEAIIRKMREDSKQLKKQLHAERDEEFASMDKYRKQTEAKILSQRNTITLGDIAIDNARGTSLLGLLQSGVREGFESATRDGAKVEKKDFGSMCEFEEAAVTEENVIGKIRKGPNGSDIINRSLTEMCGMTPTLLTEINGIVYCPKFVKIGDELCFTKRDSNKIDVYAVNGTKLRSITFDQVANIRSATMFDSKLVLATSNGLYFADLQGAVECKVMDGDICDVSIRGNVLYGLDDGNANVHILKRNDGANEYKKQKEFSLMNYSKNEFNTICASDESVFVALYIPNKILRYSHDGVLLATHTSCAAAIGQTLLGTKLCGIDREGSMLVVRQSENHRLTILTADGEWHSIPITGLRAPLSAWVEDDNLWVYDWTLTSCKHYRFE